MVAEWIIILIVAAVLLFVGPKRIPALARGVGRAMGEFRRGREEAERELRDTAKGESDVIRAARNLGIPTEGKSEEELKRQIADKVKSTGG